MCAGVLKIYTILLQISGVCPRDYPKDIDIRVFRFADQILVDFLRNLSVLVSENAIVTLEEAFTLSSNERYSAEIFFQNPNGEFNVTGAVNFSKQTHVQFTQFVQAYIYASRSYYFLV